MSCIGGVHLLGESLKNFRLVFGSNTDTRVANFDRDVRRIGLATTERNRTTSRRKTQRVHAKFEDDLNGPSLIREDVRVVCGNLDYHSLLARRGQDVKALTRPIQNICDADVCTHESKTTGIKSRKGDHVFDQAEHHLTGGDDVSKDHVSVCGIIHFSCCQHLAEADHCGKGRTQAMAHCDDELMLLLNRRDQTVVESLHFLYAFRQLLPF